MRYKKIRIIIIFVILGLCITTLAIWGIINNVKNEIKFNLLSETRSIARSINTERLQSLSGNLTDLDSPNYSRLKSQLYNIRSSNKSCRFLYIMGQNKNGDVFFSVDSQLPDSKDYAPPGLIYEEVPDEYLFSFTSGLEQVVGPVTDRWGTLLTTLIPIYDFETNELIAVLGMDIEAENWHETTFFKAYCLLGLLF